MSRIPRPSLGTASNPSSPLQPDNAFTCPEHLSSPIALQKSKPFIIGTSSIGFYRQGSSSAAATPTGSPRLVTPSVFKRRPAPSFDSATGTPQGSSPATTLRTTTPQKPLRSVSSPGGIPSGRHRTIAMPNSSRPPGIPVRSLQASPVDCQASTKHPQAANAIPLGSEIPSPGFRYLRRNAQGTLDAQRQAERPLNDLDSGYTILVSKPGGFHGEHDRDSVGAQDILNGTGNGTVSPAECGGFGEAESEQSKDNPRLEVQSDHISYRMDLIKHLGDVLGMSSGEIKAQLDVKGLLHRVEAMHKRASRLPGALSAIPQRNSVASEESYSDLLHQLSEIAELETWSGMDAAGYISESDKMSAGHLLGLYVGDAIERADDSELLGDRSRLPHRSGESARRGSVFGVKLDLAPIGSWCTSLIGGQRHELPIVIFNIIEEVFKRGMTIPGLFRLSGDAERTAELFQAYNRPPFYGDNLDISSEPIANLTSIVKRYIRDLPYPILDESLVAVFGSFCSEINLDNERDSRTSSDSNSAERHVVAAQILIRLLPPLQFSLFVYLLAFLGQLQLYPENKLDTAGIAAIFGPGICASRNKGISGLGPAASNPASPRAGDAAEKRAEVKKLSDQSEGILAWLLGKWAAISDNLLDPSYDEHFRKPDPYRGLEAALSPVQRVGPAVSPKLPEGEGMQMPKQEKKDVRALRLPERSLHKQRSMPALTNRQTAKQQSDPFNAPSELLSAMLDHDPQSGLRAQIDRARPHHPSKSPADKQSASMTRKGGIPQTPAKPKQKRSLRSRSASFGSISSLKALFRRGGEDATPILDVEVKLQDRQLSASKDDRVGVSLTRGLIMRAKQVARAAHEPDPNASAVLGSLHDLLVSKDRQVAKDAQLIKQLREELSDTAGSGSIPAQDHIGSVGHSADQDVPSHVHARISALMSDLATAQLEQARKDSLAQKLQSRASRLEKELEAAKISADSFGGLLVSAKAEVQVERTMRIKMEEEREKERKKLEEVKDMLFSE